MLPDMGSSEQRETGVGIGGALFGTVRRRVLGLLFRECGRDFYQREIVEAVDCGSGAVQRELKQLADAGLIVRTDRGRMVFYQANRDSPVFEELRGLVMKTGGLAHVVREALEPCEDQIDVAFIFGPVADGTDDALSRVDLMVVGDDTPWDISRLLGAVEPALGREIAVNIWSAGEFGDRIAAEDHLARAAMRGPRVFVVGDEDELERIAGGAAELSRREARISGAQNGRGRR